MSDKPIRDPFGEFLDLVPAELRRERHDDMQPLAAGGLGEAFEPDAGERRAHLDCRCGHLAPWQALIGVEIEGDAVRGFQPLRRRAPRVDLQYPHLHHRNEPGEVLDDEMGLAGPLVGDLDAADDVRHAARQMLLVEAFLVPALGAAHQAQRPKAEMRKRPVADRRVILREPELGNAALGIEHAVGVGQAHALEIHAAVARDADRG